MRVIDVTEDLLSQFTKTYKIKATKQSFSNFLVAKGYGKILHQTPKYDEQEFIICIKSVRLQLYVDNSINEIFKWYYEYLCEREIIYVIKDMFCDGRKIKGFKRLQDTILENILDYFPPF